MNKPHKHAEVIKAWADGAEIEYKDRNNEWRDMSKAYSQESYCFYSSMEYRVKPPKKSAGQVLYEALITRPRRIVADEPWEELHKSTQSYYIRGAAHFLEAQKNGEINGYD